MTGPADLVLDLPAQVARELGSLAAWADAHLGHTHLADPSTAQAARDWAQAARGEESVTVALDERRCDLLHRWRIARQAIDGVEDFALLGDLARYRADRR